MKRETKEYNYDWMIWSVFNAGAKALDGTRKEYESLLGVLPNYRALLH